jgi:hypothetical protein
MSLRDKGASTSCSTYYLRDDRESLIYMRGVVMMVVAVECGPIKLVFIITQSIPNQIA